MTQEQSKATTRMDPAIKAKWVAALRSGAYQQCREQLRSEQGFCCLGVLCDLIAPGEWIGGKHRGLDTMPAPSIYDAAGFPVAYMGLRCPPKIVIDGREAALDAHNDGDPSGDLPARTFAEIANAIEEQL